MNNIIFIYIQNLDIRVEERRGQSIDLALSIRGREALKLVDLEDEIVNNHGIALRARLLHGKDGSLKEMIYDTVKNNVSNQHYLINSFVSLI